MADIKGTRKKIKKNQKKFNLLDRVQKFNKKIPDDPKKYQPFYLGEKISLRHLDQETEEGFSKYEIKIEGESPVMNRARAGRLSSFLCNEFGIDQNRMKAIDDNSYFLNFRKTRSEVPNFFLYADFQINQVTKAQEPAITRETEKVQIIFSCKYLQGSRPERLQIPKTRNRLRRLFVSTYKIRRKSHGMRNLQKLQQTLKIMRR